MGMKFTKCKYCDGWIEFDENLGPNSSCPHCESFVPNWEVCSECETNMFDSNSYEMCYQCSKEAEGLIMCKKCGEHYHNGQYQMCYSCFQEFKKRNKF